MIIFIVSILGWLLIGISIFTILILKSKNLSHKDFTTLDLIDLYVKFSLLGPFSIFILIFVKYVEKVIYKDIAFKDEDD